MIPSAYVANPLVDAVIHAESGVAEHIDVAAYSRARGFVQGRLTKGETPGFEAALRFLVGDTANSTPLSPSEAMTLWQTGLILLPQERAERFTSPNATVARDLYVRHGCILLPELVTPDATRILREHYQAKLAAGALKLLNGRTDRYCAHNDPAGRVALNALREVIERIVGSPIKSSYSFASLYRGGTDLPMHIDRPQCRYTLSLQIDHQPLPPGGRSPWPVQVDLDPGAPPVDFFQTIGGGVLFRGAEITHGRPALPPDQRSWVLLLHYVDIDFDGPLD